MEAAYLIQEVTSLPQEAQQQLLDFIAFLKTRYPVIQTTTNTQAKKLTDEPFIGMWRDRDDMQDSTKWVHDLRRQEWEYNR